MRKGSTLRAMGLGALGGLMLVAPVRGQSVPELRARLQARLDSIVEHSAIPGMTVGVALPGGESFDLAAGMADTLRGRRMRAGDKMLDGSVGKTYFGAVALQLVAEGRLDLDARVRDYLGHEPWFSRMPNADLITVRQLMNHTSGVVRYELNPRFLEDLSADPLKAWTPEERLSYLFDAEPPFAPGEGWDYSDTNYILVAMIIERVTGATAYEEIQRRILDPLGLSETVPSDSPLVDGLVQGYPGEDNPFGGFPEMLVGDRLAINPQFEWGGGGFASTSEDLAVWARHIHEGRAFDAGLLPEFRHGPSAPLGPQATYGLGVIMMELPVGTAWGHSGFMPGYRTEMYYFPAWGFSVAIQINSSDGGALPMHPLRLLNGLAEEVVAWLDASGAQVLPGGTLLVANMDDDSVWLLDLVTGTRRGVVQTHVPPHEVVVSHDGDKAAVTNYGDRDRGPGNLVQFIDVGTARVTHEIEVAGYARLHGAAFLEGDSLLALTSEQTGEVLIVGVVDGVIRRTLPTGGRAPHMLALGGRWIYAANIATGTVSRMDPAAGGEPRVWDAGTRTEGVAATPDGTEGWTGSMEGGSVVGVNGETGEVVARIEGLQVPYRLAVTPDGATVVVTDPEAGTLVLIDRHEGVLAATIDVNAAARAAGFQGDASPQGFTLSADGAWAFVSTKGIDRVAAIHLATRRVVRFLEAGAGPDGIAFSPIG